MKNRKGITIFKSRCTSVDCRLQNVVRNTIIYEHVVLSPLQLSRVKGCRVLIDSR